MTDIQNPAIPTSPEDAAYAPEASSSPTAAQAAESSSSEASAAGSPDDTGTDVFADESPADDADNQMTPEDLADAFEVRAETYGMLSRLYIKEVDQEYLDELCEMRFPVESGNQLMNDGYYHIAKYLSNEWVDPITKLGVDFSATFMGGGVDTYSAAYPFESVYTSEKRLTMQGARDEVLAIYRANGLEKSSSWTVGEDHIAVELEFMRILVARSMSALRGNDLDKAMHLLVTQQNFLNDHIRVWVPVFTADMRRFSKTMFYQGLAELTEGFLQTEAALLADLILPDDDAEAPAPTGTAAAEASTSAGKPADSGASVTTEPDRQE